MQKEAGKIIIGKSRIWKNREIIKCVITKIKISKVFKSTQKCSHSLRMINLKKVTELMQCCFFLSIMHDFSLPMATTTELKRCIQVSASSGNFKTSPLWPPLPVPSEHGLEIVFYMQMYRPDWLNCGTFYLPLKCLFPRLISFLLLLIWS